ncbi:MAG: hypothetical protein V2I50_12470 [Desulfuromusa sp.]|nr:hypothetical protein [Desulfuromusa sp.]
MNFNTIIIALIWGAISSYLLLRTLGSGLAIICSLHGLLMTRWKRLANKAKPGQIRYGIILHQLLLAVSSGVLFGFLLKSGDDFIQQKFHFIYQSSSGLLWGVTATIVMIIFLRGFWRRLVVSWKITHEFDYAEKRQRTFLLKG